MLQAPQKPTVTVIHRSPFTLGVPDVWHWPADQTIEDIVKSTPLPDKADFLKRGVVMLNGHEIPFKNWSRVRPRADRGAIVTLHLPVRGGSGGGGGSSGKQVGAIVAALAITIASAGIAAGWAGGLIGGSVGALFGPSTLGATLLAAAVSFGGSILVASLSSSPVKNPASSDTQSASDATKLEAAAVQGNVLQRNSPLPRVIGTRRVFPPFIMEPTPEFVAQDEYVHAVYALAGPHELCLPRFGDAAYDPANTDSDIALQLFDGQPASTLPSYPSRYSRTFGPAVTLSTHGNDANNLAVFAAPLPTWHATNTADSPDECWLHFVISGLLRNAAPTELLRIPIRVRLRLRGTNTWRYLPELHYMDATQSQRRFQIKLLFNQTFAGPFSVAPSSRGFVEARKSVPAQNVSPLGTQWDADGYFSLGAGSDAYTSAGSGNLTNIDLQPDTALVYLSAASWPAGIYDIEVKRGATFRNVDYVSAAYTVGGAVLDLYGTRDSGALPLTHDGLFDQTNFVRAVSVKNAPPATQIGSNALMYVRARNRQVGNFSIQAGGLVYDANYNQPIGATPDHLLYCKMDGTNNSTAFVDDSPLANTMTAVGNARMDTGTKKYGTAAAFFDGTGDNINLPFNTAWNFDAYEAFTISAWVYFPTAATAKPAAATILGRFNGTGNQLSFWLGIVTPATPQLGFYWCPYGTTTAGQFDFLLAPLNSFPRDQWVHCEVTRDSAGTLRMYMNGAAMAGAATSTSKLAAFPSTAAPSIGSSFATDTTNPMWGWIDQLEVVKGSARHIEPFDPSALGTAWVDWHVTSNPAPHFRDMLIGTLNYNAIPTSMVDDATLLEWRNACEVGGFDCNMVVDGGNLLETMRIVASCGYARPYHSEVWGVVRDYDRSAESPVQIFSPRNSRNFTWRKAFPRLPDGLAVNFRDEDREYSGRQIVVYRNGVNQLNANTEQITYDGLTRRSQAIARAAFDLRQAELRSAIYSFEAPVESIVCRRGSLVGVSHDILLKQTAAARIFEIYRNASNLITGMRLDAPIDQYNTNDMHATADMHAVADMRLVGLKSSVAIREDDGTNVIQPLTVAANTTSDVITFTTPYDDGLQVQIGNLIIAGTSGKEYKRLIVSEIAPGSDLTATLTLVDEAPEIWR